MKYLITGGAGFIGSNIVDRLISDGQKVIVYDNLSTGKKLFIQHHLKNPKFTFIKADLKNFKKLTKAMLGVDFVFHMAAHADVKSGIENRFIDHEQNLEMTQNVLEAIAVNNIKNIAFASTSSVFGDANIHPTPEDYPFEPTSLYGASKAACESYIQAYASYYDFKVYIFRFVSFLGSRYTHGIIFDVSKKIMSTPKSIELFSDGTPKKSSISVSDGIEAIFKVINNSKDRINIYNIGHDEVITVSEIVDSILDAHQKSYIKKKWLGKKSNWKGDNQFVLLSNEKLKKLGWRPTKSIKESIFETVQFLIENPKLLH